MENCPGATNWKDINKLKRPGMDRTAALQSVAHGSDTVQYFQFRKSRGSSEKFHGAVVDHVGNDQTRVFRAVSDIGATLKAIDEVCGSMPNAKAAIIYDWNNRWALEDAQFTYKRDKKYQPTLLDYYRVLWERTVSVDIVDPHADLSKYDLVIAPMLYLADGETVDNLSSYVERGGTLYATYMLAMVNETDLCYLGGFPGGRLSEVFGIWNEEIDALWPAERVSVKDSDGETFEGKELCELIHAEGAEVLATYASEFYSGMPALTVNSYGKGRAYYQAFRDCGAFKDKFLGEIIDSLPVERAMDVKMPYHTSAHLRHGEKGTYMFIENYSGKEQSIPLCGKYVDMVSGEECDTAVLSEFDTKIYKKCD